MNEMSAGQQSLFRIAALDGVNEAPFVDVAKPKSVLPPYLVAIVLTVVALALLTAGLFINFPVRHTATAILGWSPRTIDIGLNEPGIVKSIAVGLDDWVESGQTLGVIELQSSVHGSITQDARIRTLDLRIQQLRSISEAAVALHSISNQIAQSRSNVSADVVRDFRAAAQFKKQIIAKLRQVESLLSVGNENGVVSLSDRMKSELNVLESEAERLSVLAETNKERVQSLNDQRVSELSHLKLKQLQSSIAGDIAKLTLERSELSEGDGHFINSPIRGKVISIPPAIGESINAQAPILKIRPAGAQIVAQANVPGLIAGQLETGALVNMVFPIGGRMAANKARISSISSPLQSNEEQLVSIKLVEKAIPRFLRSEQIAGGKIEVYFELDSIRLIDLIMGVK